MSMTYDCCQVPANDGHGRSVKRTGQSFGQSFVDRIADQWAALRVSLQVYLADRERRDAFCALLELDDRRLQDIGVSRADVQWATRLPVSVNAGLELRKIAASRR